ncbi:MAG: hypothetical protein LBT35_00495 [Tannerella sp.]|jgi:nucleoside permease NupC|nr:hypothetical protein [Tannerella sp.]
MNRKKIIRIIVIIIGLIVIATLVAYFAYRPEREWTAFYIACCGGVLVANLILSIIFVSKNFKDKDGR